MKRSNLFSLLLLGLTIGTATLTTSAARAADRELDDNWHLTGGLFLWGVSINGTTSRGDIDFDLDFGDVLDNLDFALLGTLEARKSRWLLLGDFTYLDISGDRSGSRTDANLVTFRADAEMQGLVVHVLGGYNLVDTDAGSANVVFGGRYLDVETKLKVSVTQPVQTPGLEVRADGSGIDAVIGLKGGIGLSRSFHIPWYVDVGTGESDFSWQAVVGVAWRPRWGEIALGYRHIEWDFESDSPLQDLELSGPGVNFRYHFF